VEAVTGLLDERPRPRSDDTLAASSNVMPTTAASAMAMDIPFMAAPVIATY
jgi:hypothetical protein